MDALAAGLITLANGVLAIFGFLRNPVVVAFVICALSLVWLARVRIEELDRLGTKPTVSRH